MKSRKVQIEAKMTTIIPEVPEPNYVTQGIADGCESLVKTRVQNSVDEHEGRFGRMIEDEFATWKLLRAWVAKAIQ